MSDKPWVWEMKLVDLVDRSTRSNNIYHRVMSETERIEVIEKSAYEALERRYDELKEIEQKRYQQAIENGQKYQDMKAKAEKLAEALERSCNCKMGLDMDEYVDCPACDALAELEAEGDLLEKK